MLTCKIPEVFVFIGVDVLCQNSEILGGKPTIIAMDRSEARTTHKCSSMLMKLYMLPKLLLCN